MDYTESIIYPQGTLTPYHRGLGAASALSPAEGLVAGEKELNTFSIAKHGRTVQKQPHKLALAIRVGLSENPFQMSAGSLGGDVEFVRSIAEGLSLE